MKPESEPISFMDWTLRVRPPADAGGRLLLMLHGWQGDENSMWIFARNLPADYWIVAPRALHVAPEGGYTWRTPVSGGWPTLETLMPAVDALVDLLDAWAREHDIADPAMDMIGFSQGAALSFAFALLHPERVRKLGILAGFAPEGADAIAVPGKFTGKHFFVAHGSKDQIVPVEQAQRSVRLLESAGARVSFCQSEVGHKLSLDCLKSLEDYLGEGNHR